MPPDGWEEWSRFILEELKRLSTAYERLNTKWEEEITLMKTEIAILKVKSGIWGFIGGAVLISIFLLTSRILGG